MCKLSFNVALSGIVIVLQKKKELICMMFTYDPLPAVRQGCNVCRLHYNRVLEQLMLIRWLTRFTPPLFCQHKARWLPPAESFTSRSN